MQYLPVILQHMRANSPLRSWVDTVVTTPPPLLVKLVEAEEVKH